MAWPAKSGVHLSARPDGLARLCCAAKGLLETEKKQANSHAESLAGCKPPEPLRFDRRSLQEIWNSEALKSIRLAMLRGEKLKACANCYAEERTGKTSKRTRENKNFLSQNYSRFAEAAACGGRLSGNPVYLDLRLGNLCNLKCRSCGPLFSSAWAEEIRRRQSAYEGEPALKEAFSDGYKGALRRQRQFSSWFKAGVFLETISKVRGGVQKIYLSGGEPLLIKDQLALIDRFAESSGARQITVSLHSNLTRLPAAFLEKLSAFKRIDFGASIDAFGSRNNWLRAPSRFFLIEKNMESLCAAAKKRKNIAPYINCVTSAYNILSLSGLLDWSRSLEARFGLAVPVHFDMLHWPAFQHISVLRGELRARAAKNLKAASRRYKLREQEENGLSHLIRILESPPPSRADSLRKQLLSATAAIDKIRGESFFKSFPEFEGRF